MSCLNMARPPPRLLQLTTSIYLLSTLTLQLPTASPLRTYRTFLPKWLTLCWLPVECYGRIMLPAYTSFRETRNCMLAVIFSAGKFTYKMVPASSTESEVPHGQAASSFRQDMRLQDSQDKEVAMHHAPSPHLRGMREDPGNSL